MSYYPGADRTTAWYGDTYPGDPIEPCRIVLHSTETVSLPSYRGGASAPHLTAVPDFEREIIHWYQHIRLDRNARALKNPAGGVETNRAGAIQVEIVGTCNRAFSTTREHLEMWNLPPWAIRDLGRFIAWCEREYGIPLIAPVRWTRYPGDDSARFTGSQWLRFTGTCGHLHVPENDHGDPGDIEIDAIMREAAIMASKEIALAVWQCDIIPNQNPDGTPVNPDNPTVQAQYAAGLALKHARAARQNTDHALTILGDLTARVEALRAEVGALRATAIDVAVGEAAARIEAAANTAVASLVAQVEGLHIEVTDDTQ